MHEPPYLTQRVLMINPLRLVIFKGSQGPVSVRAGRRHEVMVDNSAHPTLVPTTIRAWIIRPNKGRRVYKDARMQPVRLKGLSG